MAMHCGIGDALVDESARCQQSALLVAPFVKAGAFNRIIAALPSMVELTVITRWSPEEIAAGVSDLEVWETIRSRERSGLRLFPHVHAKYYRFDEVAFVGSANLTCRGLGWAPNSNLELLIRSIAQEFRHFEEHLLSRSLAVNNETHDLMRDAATLLSKELPQPPRALGAIDDTTSTDWFPASLHVEHLFDCYQNRRDRVISSVFEDGRRDIAQLNPPAGLSQTDFNRFVAARLQQSSAVATVDARAATAVDRASGQSLLEQLGIAEDPATYEEWDILARWLVAFLPNRYRIKYTSSGPALERSQVIQ